MRRARLYNPEIWERRKEIITPRRITTLHEPEGWAAILGIRSDEEFRRFMESLEAGDDEARKLLQSEEYRKYFKTTAVIFINSYRFAAAFSPYTDTYIASSGTATAPTGATQCIVTSDGSGGGGAKDLNEDTGAGGGGGGARCVSTKTISAGNTLVFVSAAGGTGKTGADGNGGNGSAATTSSGTGGFAGLAHSAGGGINGRTTASGGTGGTASGGTTNTNGTNAAGQGGTPGNAYAGGAGAGGGSGGNAGTTVAGGGGGSFENGINATINGGNGGRGRTTFAWSAP